MSRRQHDLGISIPQEILEALNAAFAKEKADLAEPTRAEENALVGYWPGEDDRPGFTRVAIEEDAEALELAQMPSPMECYVQHYDDWCSRSCCYSDEAQAVWFIADATGECVGADWQGMTYHEATRALELAQYEEMRTLDRAAPWVASL